MDKIGTSHIATVDFVIWGTAIFLFWRLRHPPRNNVLSRAIAVIAACIVAATPFVLIFVDLNAAAVKDLSIIALFLCFSLSDWHNKRLKTSPETAAELPSEPLSARSD